MLTEIKTQYEHYFLDEQGRRQGEYKLFWFTGKVAIHTWFVNRNYHGEYRYTGLSSAKINNHCFYVHGIQHGESTSVNESDGTYKHCFYVNGNEVALDEIPLPTTEEELMLFKIKYDIKLLPVE